MAVINISLVDFLQNSENFNEVTARRPLDDIISQINNNVFNKTEADGRYTRRSNNLNDVANPVTAFNNIKQTATTTSRGVVEVATNAEALAGTANVFPDAADVHAAFNQYGLGVFLSSKILAGSEPTGFYRPSEFTFPYSNTVTSGAAIINVRTGNDRGIQFIGRANQTASDKPEIAFREQVGTNSYTDTVTLWHTGNDGSNSGLDADLLDGQHGSYYRNVGNMNAGTLPISRGGTGSTTAAGAFNNIKQFAGTAYAGVTERATVAETVAGTDTSRHVTSEGVHAAFNQYGLGNSIELFATDDLNNITKNGNYFWLNDTPANAPENFCNMAVVVDKNGNPTQKIFERSLVPREWVRVLASGVWYQEQIWNSGNLSDPMTLSGTQTVSGAKNFTGGLSVNGSTISNQKMSNWDTAFGWGDFRDFGPGSTDLASTSLLNSGSANDIDFVSWHRTTTGVANLPSGSPDGLLETFKTSEATNLQRYQPINSSDSLATRRLLSNGTWTDWIRLLQTGDYGIGTDSPSFTNGADGVTKTQIGKVGGSAAGFLPTAGTFLHMAYSANNHAQFGATHPNNIHKNKFWGRTRTDGVWNDRVQFWTTGEMPNHYNEYGLGLTSIKRSADFASIPMVTGFDWPNSTSDQDAPSDTTFGNIRVTVNSTVGVDWAARGSRGAYWRGIESGVAEDWKRLWDDNNLVKVTSSGDSTAGRVLLNGSHGLGDARSDAMDSGDLNDLRLASFRGVGAATVLNRPEDFFNTLGSVITTGYSGSSLRHAQLYLSIGGQAAIRGGQDTWGDWKELWTTGNLVKTSGQMDTTAGRMLKVGDFGLGAQGYQKTINGDEPSGFYRPDSFTFPASGTVTSGAVIFNAKTQSSRGFQIVGRCNQSSGVAPEVVFREQVSATSYNTATAWHTGNLSDPATLSGTQTLSNKTFSNQVTLTGNYQNHIHFNRYDNGNVWDITQANDGVSANGTVNGSSLRFMTGSGDPEFVFRNNGDLRVTGDVTANFSDGRLKDITERLSGSRELIRSWIPFKYTPNSLAKSLGAASSNDVRIGLDAGCVEKTHKELTTLAPFDIGDDGESRSGENYLTLKYDRVVAVLVNATNEQSDIIDEQKEKIESLESRLDRLEKLLEGSK